MNGPKLLSSVSEKGGLFDEIFSKNSNLDDLSISFPAFLFTTVQKLHNILVSPKLVNTVITDLDSSKVPDTDYTQAVVVKNFHKY